MLARTTIRSQLALLVLAVALPAAGLVAHALHGHLVETRSGAERQLQAQAQDAATRIEVTLLRRAELLARMAERPIARALGTKGCDPTLAEVMAMQSEFLSFVLYRSDGQSLCAAGNAVLPPEAVRTAPWFREGLASGRFVAGGAFANPPDGTWVTMLTQPVRDAAGEIGGLLVLAVDLKAMQQRLLPALPPDTIVVVFDRERHYVVRTLDPERWIGRAMPEAQRAQLPASIAEPFEITGVDGIARLSVGAAVPAIGWQVYAAMPVEQVYAGYRALLGRSLALGAAALAAGALLAWRIGAGIARPIDALAAAAADVAVGRALALPDAGGREVAAVAADLSRLAAERAQLQDRQALLSASYRELADGARDFVFVVDVQDERIVEANRAALEAYGYSREEMQAMTVSDLRAPQARARIATDRVAALRPDGALYETVHQRKDGSAMDVEVSVRTLEIGGRKYFQSFVRDVGERKRGEALLAGQSAVLALVAQGAPLAESLDALARLVQSQVSGVLATILLLDDDGAHPRHGAAPSLPRAYVDALDGLAIGPTAGACGSAAFRRAPVVSEDIAADPLWQDWRALALAHGLRACASTPIVDAAGQVLGTLALYARAPGRPGAQQQGLIATVTHTAAIAIASARGARRQREQLDELLRWQALMLGREERMRVLKDEVDALCARLGEPPRHAGGGAP